MQLSDAHRWSSGSRAHRDQVSGADSGGVPPVPIPNTAVKTASADGSRTAGSLESRSVPDQTDEPAGTHAGGLSWFSGAQLRTVRCVGDHVVQLSPVDSGHDDNLTAIGALQDTAFKDAG